MEKVFENDDLRKYIFKYLRKKPKAECYNCNKILIWDNKINNYIRFPRKYLEDDKYTNIYYCINCWRCLFISDGFVNIDCTII